MRKLRRLSVALVFTFVLITPAFAGEISTPLVPPPPPQDAQAATTNGEISTTVAGQIDTGSSEATSTGAAAEAALSLLESVVSLF